MFNWPKFIAEFNVGFTLFMNFALPIIVTLALAAFTVWIMASALEKFKRTFSIHSKRKSRASHRHFDLPPVPGADSQPDIPAIATDTAIADPVPAAEDVQTERQMEVEEMQPNDVRPRVAATGDTWIERLLKLPEHFFPDTEESFFAPVLYCPEKDSFMPHPKHRFYGTATCWSRVLRGANIPTIDSDKECQKIKSIPGKPIHLQICGRNYALDHFYKPASVAAE